MYNIVPRVKIYKTELENIDSNDFRKFYRFSKVDVD